MELLNWNYLQRTILKNLEIKSSDTNSVMIVAQVLRPYKDYDLNLQTRNLCIKVAKEALGYE